MPEETTEPTRKPRARGRLLALLAALLVVAVAGAVAGIAIDRSTGGDTEAVTPTTGSADTSTTTTGAAASTGPVVGVAKAASGVVSITSTLEQEPGFGPPQETVGSGSGFVLDTEGRILTNEHVVDGASKIHVTFADGTKVHATLLATDPLYDLAVIQVDVDASVLHPLPLGTAEGLEVGEIVVAIGNPFGLDRSVSAGIVSGLRRQIVAPNGFTLSNAIQTDAAINHGNSGGPLLDADGRVIGVNAQIADSGVDANVGVGFAVALDEAAREVIDALEQGETVRHPWLGVSLDDVDAILATSDEVDATSGALVTGVVAGGPADDAGVRGGSTVTSVDGVQYCLGGDIVVAVGDTTVASSGDLQLAIADLEPGDTAELAVVRADGSKETLEVELEAQPTSAPQTTTGCG